MVVSLTDFIAGVGVGGGIVSAYVKLSLPAYTVKVLNGRYPTTAVHNANFQAIQSKMDMLGETITDRLDNLPCHGNNCQCVGLAAQVAENREEIQKLKARGGHR